MKYSVNDRVRICDPESEWFDEEGRIYKVYDQFEDDPEVGAMYVVLMDDSTLYWSDTPEFELEQAKRS